MEKNAIHTYAQPLKIRINPYFVMINISNRLILKLAVLQVSVEFMGRRFFVEVRW